MRDLTRRVSIIMHRLTIASIFGLVAAVAANAGSVLIGGSTGLSSNYILQGAGAGCAAGAGNCVTGSTTGYAEKNYDNVLFAGATLGGVSPTPFTGYTQNVGIASGSTATDTTHGVNFAMVSDGVNANGVSNNYWQSMGTGAVTDSIVVPIGVFGATDVWTMLNNDWGTLGGNDTTVTFNFGATSNATSGLTPIVVALTNNNGAVGNGELHSAITCTGGTSICATTGLNPSKLLSQGVVINGVTVNEGNVFGASYDSIASSQTFYAGSSLSGKVKLDDQQFVFNNPALTSQWLVSMTITENMANNYSSSPTAPSETALSAITVDTASDVGAPAVPEPGTVLLLMSSLGGLGLMRLRRRG
jgi:hypothetical protein